MPYKTASIFSTKDKIPFFLKSMVVYKFVCPSCNACYMGETARHLPTRIKGHLKTDKKLHLYQHLSSNQNCLNCCTDDCFSILDYASTKFKDKESTLHKMLDPILNKQKKTLKITLRMQVGIYFFLIILFHISYHVLLILQLDLINH